MFTEAAYVYVGIPLVELVPRYAQLPSKRSDGNRESQNAFFRASAAFTCKLRLFHSWRDSSAWSMLESTSTFGVSKKLSESSSWISWRGLRFNKRFNA